MILSVTSSKKETEKDQLFYMIDYTPDSISQWFRGRCGPRGTGYMLSHSRKLKEEALSIAEWLPVYLAAIYGKDNVRRFFPMETWRKIKGWEWDRLDQSFITQEIKLMQRLDKHGPLADILAMEQLTLQEEL